MKKVKLLKVKRRSFRTALPVLKCLRCSHEWVPRKAEVITCPGCGSAYFNKPVTEPKKNWRKKKVK